MESKKIHGREWIQFHSRKGDNMPKKRTPPEPNQYLVTWTEGGYPHWTECIGLKIAINVYRQMREIHGDNVRVAKVLVEYGTEI